MEERPLTNLLSFENQKGAVLPREEQAPLPGSNHSLQQHDVLMESTSRARKKILKIMNHSARLSQTAEIFTLLNALAAGELVHECLLFRQKF